MPVRVRDAILGAGLLAGGAAWAAPSAPPFLATSNLQPLAAVRGLPRDTATRPESVAALRVDWASHSVHGSRGGETVALDGETRRYTLALGAPLGAGWGARLELDYLAHSGGVLDPMIEDWHRFFGLPQGERPNQPHHRVRYIHTGADGEAHVLQDRDVAGAGDAAGTLTYRLTGEGETGLGLGGRLEAPSGKADPLLGSGSWEAAAWLGGDWGQAMSWGRYRLHGALGALWSQRGEVLPQRARRRAPFGRVAGTWEPRPGWTLLAQLDGHGPLYRGGPTPLGAPAAELRLAGRAPLPRGLRLTLGFSEDIAVATAPDITFHVRLRRTWDLLASP